MKPGSESSLVVVPCCGTLAAWLNDGTVSEVGPVNVVLLEFEKSTCILQKLTLFEPV